MTGTQHNLKPNNGPRSQLAILLAALVCVGLVSAVPAWAGFEEVGTFAGSATPVPKEEFSEEVQLDDVGGMAVNYTGAGGVPKGTVYAIGDYGVSGPYVAMFEPTAGGGLEFKEDWRGGNHEPEIPFRCGPLVGTSCTRPVGLSGNVVDGDVDVDQSTGRVYALYNENYEAANPEKRAVVEYSPDGSEIKARFGEIAPLGKTTQETPEEVHGSSLGGLAVDGSGDVFVYDINKSYTRLMEFRPEGPADEEYEYAGVGTDIDAGFSGNPTRPVVDAAGNLYAVGVGEEFLEMFDPSQPASGPVCRFRFAKAKIKGMTVDPVSGRVFFFSTALPKRVHELGPCNRLTGRFESGGMEETGAFEVKPERDDLYALAFDPVRNFSASRPAGVLYGGAPGPVPTVEHGVGEPGQSSLGYIFAQAEEAPASVGGELVSRVGSDSARVSATVDPNGFNTTYFFEYLPESVYAENGDDFADAGRVPVVGASVGQGEVGVNVAVTLTGLAADTSYRYRVVASSLCSPGEPEKVCEVFGAPQSFRTYPVVGGMPDDRVYELVSPPDKDGGQVFPLEPFISSCGPESECKPGAYGAQFPIQVSPEGNGIVFMGTAFTAGQGASVENEYLASRSSSGWQTVDLTPSLLRSRGGGGYLAFDTTLGEGLLEQQGRPVLSPQTPSEYQDLYSQSTGDPGTVAPLVMETPPDRSAGEFKLEYAGAAQDLSRVFFAANDALTEEVSGIAPAAVDGGQSKFNLYERERSSGRLRLVNILPGNSTTAPGATFGGGGSHAISNDGSRAFWSDETGQVYVRIDGSETRKIEDSGRFLVAATDGSRALLDDGCLYELKTGVCTDLTAGKGGFQGIAGQSDDLSHVYFIDTNILTGGEENENCKEVAGKPVCEQAETGKPNLYSWEQGSGTRYIATLTASEGGEADSGLTHDWARRPSGRTAEASPDGQYLTFESSLRLTGFDNTGPCAVPSSGSGFAPGPCAEVFLYDSQSNRLRCVSCNPSGAGPLGWSVLPKLKGGGWLAQPRYLTDAGRLYFDSEDSLTPADTNSGAEDVYEYEPDGVPAGPGACQREAGCLALISAGREGTDSNFLAADETGKNVFFTTRDKLSPADTDDLIDVYDARENGGFPEPAKPSECQGEACQAPTNGPLEQTPASYGFIGSGNIAPPMSGGPVKPKTKTKTPTPAEQLAKALKRCRRQPKRQRHGCEVKANKRYRAHSTKGGNGK